MFYLRVLGIWLLILVCAIVNGAFRELVLLPNLPRFMAFVLSGALLSACVLVTAILLIPSLGRLSARRYWGVGACWLALTVAFEFGFGGLVRRMSWEQLLGAYTFKDGNIWPLVLGIVFVAPRLAGRLRGISVRAHD